jgi:formyltetrahydrofolate-dependent phosphoribosylglycinamide formyltransferase
MGGVPSVSRLLRQYKGGETFAHFSHPEPSRFVLAALRPIATVPVLQMPTPKLKTTDELAGIRETMQAEGRRLVLTNGCFDLLHVGHVRYLQLARDLGDALVVALNSDASVRSLKGPTRPITSEQDRAEVLAALASVDFVTIFPSMRVTDVISAVQPHIYVKGGDYTIETLDAGERAALQSAGTEIRLLPLTAGKSTTGIVKRTMTGGPLRLGVLGSGKGSNFRAIADAISAGTLEAVTRIVVSDVQDAGILALAELRGIPAQFINPGRFKTRMEPEAEERLVGLLIEAQVELVVLAGYMRMIKAPLLEAFPNRIINIHPSLLPQFPGLQAWRQAIDAGASESGCTVHFVDGGMDTGAIIAQRKVPVLPGDTPETLHARIQVEEHRLYPEVIAGLAREIRGA